MLLASGVYYKRFHALYYKSDISAAIALASWRGGGVLDKKCIDKRIHGLLVQIVLIYIVLFIGSYSIGIIIIYLPTILLQVIKWQVRMLGNKMAGRLGWE